MFKVEYLEVFNDYYLLDNKCLIIPELWKPIVWDDSKYLSYIKETVSTEYSNDCYATDYLYIKNISFFDKLKYCGYYSIFTAVDINSSVGIHNKFYLKSIYNDVMNNLVFVGWNPRCSIGSAFTDGRYPIYLLNNNGRYILKKDNSKFNVNGFGLLNSREECYEICDINNKLDYNYNENDYWYPTKLYVDINTYSRIIKFIK